MLRNAGLLLGGLGAVGLHGQIALAQTPPTQPPVDPGASTVVTLPPVEVTGTRVSPGAVVGPPPPPYAGGQVASGGRLGALGNVANQDTPFSQTNYTEELIRNQQDRRLSDVLENNPAVRLAQSQFSVQPNVYVRGLNLNARNFAFDGLYGLYPIYRPQIEGVERVEVLTGPAALLYGFSPNGDSVGVINVIPKRAGDTPLNRVTAEYASPGMGGGSFDVSRRFGDGGAFGVRANGAYRNGDTPIRFQREQFGDAILGTDYRGEKLRVSVDLGFQHFDQTAPIFGFSLAPGVAVPRAPSLTSTVTNPWSSFTSQQVFGAVRAEYDILPNLTAYAALGGSRYRFNVYGTFGQRILNTAGDVAITTSPGFQGLEDQWTAETGIRGQAQLGPVSVKSVLSYSHYALFQPYNFAFGPTQRTNLYNPTYIPQLPRVANTTPNNQSYENLDGVTLVNTFSVLGDRVQLTAGGRFQVAQQNDGVAGGARSDYSSKVAGTPLVALVVKPIPQVSLYASYAQGFGFGPTAPIGAVNVNQVLPPVVTEQVETGIKLDFGRIGGSLSFFKIDVPSGFVDPTTLVFGLLGNQRNQGADLTVYGEPVNGLRVFGGIEALDAKLTKTANGALDGRIAPAAPAFTLNVGGEYDIPGVKGLTATGLVIHTARQAYDAANTQSIPSWTRLDLGARYSFGIQGKPVTARFNAQNVTGERYWASTGQGQLTLGTPRTFLFSLSSDF